MHYQDLSIIALLSSLSSALPASQGPANDPYTFDCNPNPPEGSPQINWADCGTAYSNLQRAFPSKRDIPRKDPKDFYTLTHDAHSTKSDPIVCPHRTGGQTCEMVVDYDLVDKFGDPDSRLRDMFVFQDPYEGLVQECTKRGLFNGGKVHNYL